MPDSFHQKLSHADTLISEERFQEVLKIVVDLIQDGWRYLSINTYDKALKIAARCKAMFEKIGDQKGIASSLSLIGHIHMLKDDFDLFPKVSEFEIEILLQPSTIKRYIESVQELQSLDMSEYFPLSKRAVKVFFSKISPKFEVESIKYSDSDNLDIICQIISYIGRSGYNYIKSADNVITLNQPVLIFYGIEQLSTYFTFMHFNFTGENMKINSIRDKFRRHGINPGEFNNVKSDSLMDELLDKKISLLEEGAAQHLRVR